MRKAIYTEGKWIPGGGPFPFALNSWAGLRSLQKKTIGGATSYDVASHLTSVAILSGA